MVGATAFLAASESSYNNPELLLLFWQGYPMDCTAGFLPFTISWSLLKSYSLTWWCHPIILSSVVPFLLPLNLAQHQCLFLMEWGSTPVAKLLSFSFSSVPLNFQDWFSFRIDWFDLHAVQWTPQESSNTINSWCLSLLCSSTYIRTWLLPKS